jgi:hypothetical protein
LGALPRLQSGRGRDPQARSWLPSFPMRCPAPFHRACKGSPQGREVGPEGGDDEARGKEVTSGLVPESVSVVGALGFGCGVNGRFGLPGNREDSINRRPARTVAPIPGTGGSVGGAARLAVVHTIAIKERVAPFPDGLRLHKYGTDCRGPIPSAQTGEGEEAGGGEETCPGAMISPDYRCLSNDFLFSPALETNPGCMESCPATWQARQD